MTTASAFFGIHESIKACFHEFIQFHAVIQGFLFESPDEFRDHLELQRYQLGGWGRSTLTGGASVSRRGNGQVVRVQGLRLSHVPPSLLISCFHENSPEAAARYSLLFFFGCEIILGPRLGAGKLGMARGETGYSRAMSLAGPRSKRSAISGSGALSDGRVQRDRRGPRSCGGSRAFGHCSPSGRDSLHLLSCPGPSSRLLVMSPTLLTEPDRSMRIIRACRQ